jgi:cellulose biosynthesis protein BcsQ
MRIRLAILESDTVYLNRIVSAFIIKYADKLEVYSFTDKDAAIQFLKSARIDVFLAGESFQVTEGEIPSACGFAYLVEEEDIRTFRGAEAVNKFQKTEMIYRRILGFFSEKTAAVTGVGMDGGEGCKALAFLSAAGGTGSSTAAAACAMNFAQKGKRVLYLNLERFGSADVFFSGDGSCCFGDVIYALKRRMGSLGMKLESAVRHDVSGVFFFSSTRMALDMGELEVGEIREILGVLRTSGAYDYLILDMDFSLEQAFLKLLQECSSIIFVADGSQGSNVKLERALESLKILEDQCGVKLLMKSGILYNRFSSHTSRKTAACGLREYGGMGRFEGFETQKLLQQLKAQPVFDVLEREV